MLENADIRTTILMQANDGVWRWASLFSCDVDCLLISVERILVLEFGRKSKRIFLQPTSVSSMQCHCSNVLKYFKLVLNSAVECITTHTISDGFWKFPSAICRRITIILKPVLSLSKLSYFWWPKFIIAANNLIEM